MSKNSLDYKYRKNRCFDYEPPNIKYDILMSDVKKIVNDEASKKEQEFLQNKELISKQLFSLLRESPELPRRSQKLGKSGSLYKKALACGINIYKKAGQKPLKDSNNSLKSVQELVENFKLALEYVLELDILAESASIKEEDKIFKIDTVKEFGQVFKVRDVAGKTNEQIQQEILDQLNEFL